MKNIFFFFCNVRLSFGEKQIHENTCFKQHAFLVGPLGFLFEMIFVFPNFRPQRGVTPCTKKRTHLESPICAFRASQIAKGPFRSNKGAQKRRPKRGPLRVLEGPKGSGPATQYVKNTHAFIPQVNGAAERAVPGAGHEK